jgi:hypothetical protein
MKNRILKSAAISFIVALILSTFVYATPSTVDWTPCTTSIQPYLKGNLDYDTYVRDTSALPVDYGLLVGVLPFSQVQAEIGYDAVLPVASQQTFRDANYFNAKIGTPENSLLPVGISVGIFEVGLDTNVTNYDVIHAEIGKTFDYIGNLCIGGYSGNSKLLVNDNGKTDNSGFMASWTSSQVGKFNLIADYMSGNNALSAVGAAVTAFFTDSVSVILGPVFPLSRQFAGSSKAMFTLQLDATFELFPQPAPAKQ